MKNVTECQGCGSRRLDGVAWLGNLPLVNDYRKIGEPAREQTLYPAELLRCADCTLVQLGCVLPKEVLFPESYPYTSSTTLALRENFADLARECRELGFVTPGDLVIDIGGNDGNLLSNFQNAQRVLNVTPESLGIGACANRNIPAIQAYWQAGIADQIARGTEKKAELITATNVFAHVEDPHTFVEEVLKVLAPGGVFATESHYLGSLLANNEFDAVYHEHLRYYSVESLSKLLEKHGLEVFFAKQIPTHGGSIRVYAARKGERVKRQFDREPLACDEEAIGRFVVGMGRAKQVLGRKLINARHIRGVGAPSRAATLIAYCGISESDLPVVYETAGSHKIGHYMPGTRIEVREEPDRIGDEAETLLLLSWHIAADLIPVLKAKGFRGRFLAPLPEPRLL